MRTMLRRTLMAGLALGTGLAGSDAARAGGPAARGGEEVPHDADRAAARAGEGATVTVTVRFTGTPPPPKPVNFGPEKQCSVLHATGAPTYEDLVVNANGTLKWTLVHVKDEVADGPAPSTEPAVFDQLGCIFKPHAVIARVGQPVEFRNGDAILHNVRGLSKQAQAFNVAQPTQGMKAGRTFKKPEIGMPLKCDVHYWMTAYLHVLPHAFGGLSGEDGTVVLQGLPAGTYTVEAWHEKLGPQTQSVTVQDGESKALEFVFSAS
jgi:plastocyanin